MKDFLRNLNQDYFEILSFLSSLLVLEEDEISFRGMAVISQMPWLLLLILVLRYNKTNTSDSLGIFESKFQNRFGILGYHQKDQRRFLSHYKKKHHYPPH